MITNSINSYPIPYIPSKKKSWLNDIEGIGQGHWSFAPNMERIHPELYVV